ncbi:hypothetical protein DA2_1383 [Desulfovibrio sp. A2]|nr:hypothetical protein DA2_1383 [Desulfovibrio sp. A2]
MSSPVRNVHVAAQRSAAPRPGPLLPCLSSSALFHPEQPNHAPASAT